jgi:hypothetical protein
MSTVKTNTIEPASGGTVTITGAALTTPALGTPASGTLTNCTGLPASGVVNTPAGGISATTVQAALEELDSEKFDKAGGTVSGSVTITGAMNAAGVSRVGDDTAAIYLGKLSGTAAYLQSKSSVGDPRDLMFFGSSEYGRFESSGGAFRPGADNTQSNGTGSYRWSVIYAGTGAINTSDAREKTEVSKLTSAEISAAKALAREIGSFRFLNGRRTHIGMTVQRAIEIMRAWGLDPFKYAFICHDAWGLDVVEHPAIEAQAATPAMPAVYETRESRETVILDGQETELVRTYLHEVSPAVPAKKAVQAQPARTEVIREAGDRYGFRYDQLMMFIAAGVLA